MIFSIAAIVWHIFVSIFFCILVVFFLDEISFKKRNQRKYIWEAFSLFSSILGAIASLTQLIEDISALLGTYNGA